jgi:hypothetical protein
MRHDGAPRTTKTFVASTFFSPLFSRDSTLAVEILSSVTIRDCITL